MTADEIGGRLVSFFLFFGLVCVCVCVWDLSEVD